MRILFITDRNLTHDIRTFHELMYAVSLGYKADLVAFYDEWSKDIEKVHLELAKPLHSYYINPAKDYISRIVSAFAKMAYPLMKKDMAVNAFSLDYRTAVIWKKLQNIGKNYDLIVAHGFNSLYPAYVYAKKNNIKLAFDAASFIPELDYADYDVERFHKNKFLFKTILPSLSYFTYSTDLVGVKLQKILDLSQYKGEHFPLRNSYPESFFSFRPSVSDKVEFVWLGHKIDLCPDLEMVLPTLKRYRRKLRLHIFGQVTNRFKQTYKDYQDFLVYHEPMPVDLLLKTLASYDIGLAVYLTYVSPEKNYTLSNKIFAYVQNGLYTIASDTVSQRIFFSENPQLGRLVLPNIEHLAQAVYDIINNIEQIRSQKQQRFNLAQSFSWKYESQKLQKIWRKLEQND